MRRPLATRLRPLAALPVVLLAACGSGGGSSPSLSASPSASGAAPTATVVAAPTATATPAAPALLVWVVGSGSSGASQVRTVPVGGGIAHVVASLPSDVLALASGSGKLAVASTDHSLQVIDLASGAVDTYPVSSDSQVFAAGGAFSPDGKRFAFVVVRADPFNASLQVLDLVTKVSTTLRTFSTNPVDVPQRWNVDAMVGATMPAFADAVTVALVRLDPTTGERLASSDIGGPGTVPISTDGVHAAMSTHNPLGDEGDAPGGQFPQPFNTLRAVTIGSPPADVFREPHHQVAPLALSASGGTICYSDDPAAGGFAGITLSPAFGLFLRTGSTSTQLAHWDGSRWDRGVFVGSAVALANHTSSAEKLELVSAGGAASTLDTVSGGDEPVFLGLA
jgi:hypothetical protein